MTRPVRYTLLVLLALAVPVLPFLAIGELPGERWLSHQDDNAFRFGLLGAGLLAADLLLPVPSSIVGTLLGARLGTLAGWLWGWAGLTVGSLVGYGAGRLLLSRLAGGVPQTPTVMLLFLTRPVPVLAEALVIGAGAARTPPLAFILATGAGNGIYALALAANGAAWLPESLAGPGLVLPLGLPVLAWWGWRWWAARERTRAVSGRG